MAGHDHDHELVIGSTTYRLNLMRDADGIPMYAISEEMVTPQDTNFDPNSLLALRFVQKDWSGGAGQGIWKDPTRYGRGVGVETSEPGALQMGYNLQNDLVGRFCLAIADDGGAFTTQTTAAANATTNDMTLLPATPVVNDAYYLGASETFSRIALKISTNGAGTWTITWEYYNGSTWATLTMIDDAIDNFRGGTGWKVNNFTVPSAWATTSVNSVSGYWVRARVSAYTSITTQPKGEQCRIAKMGLSLTETPVAIYNSPLLGIIVATANKVFATISGVGTGLSESTTNPAGVLQFLQYNGVIYAARGASTAYAYSTDGNTWTNTTLADPNANGFVSAPNPAGTQDVLWKFKTPNEVKNTTDGRIGGVEWTSANYIGDTATNITNLMLLNDRLLVGKTNNMYYLDSDGGVHPLMDELKSIPTTANFQYAEKWQGNLYFSLLHHIGEMTSSYEINTVGPHTVFEDYRDSFMPVISAGASGLATGNDSLFAMYSENGTYCLYRGRVEGEKWSWHPVADLGSNACNTMAFGNNSTDFSVLYLGYGNYIKYIQMAHYPYSAYTGFYHNAVSTLYTSYWDGGYPQADKMIQSVITQARDCAADTPISISYMKDNETSFTSLVSDITSSGVVETYLTSALTFKRIVFKIDIAFSLTGTITGVPLLEYFQVNGVLKPEVSRVHECTYSMESHTGLKGSTIRDALRTARTSTALVKLADLTFDESTSGTNYHWVVMLPGYPQEITVVHQKGQPAEKAIKCRWLEVDFTIS